MSDVAKLDVAAGWHSATTDSTDSLRQFLTTMRKSGPHGHAFCYASVNSDLLGWMLERSSGTDLPSLFSELVCQPMAAEFDAYITLGRYGAPQSDGGFCITARDLARFGQLHLQNGIASGKQTIYGYWYSWAISMG